MSTNPKEQQDKYEKIVDGYIRKESKLFTNVTFPLDIMTLIFDFYYDRLDQWYPKYKISCIHIDGFKLKNCEYHNGSGFGTYVIKPDMVHSWTIKLLNFNNKTSHGEGRGPWIGIIKDRDEFMQKWYCNTGWARDGTGCAFVCGITKLEGNGCTKKQYAVPFINKNDLMVMTLDTSAWTLSYKINNVDYGVAFENIEPDNYRLAVTISAYMTGTEIELVNAYL